VADLEITLKLPAELVERARAVGLVIDQQTEQWVALLEAQIRRREAGLELNAIGAQLQSLPAEMKPSPEEIEAEIRAYWLDQNHFQKYDPLLP